VESILDAIGNTPFVRCAAAHRRTGRPRDLAADRGPHDGVLPGHGHGELADGVSDALKPHGVFIQAHEPASSAAISGGEPGPFLILSP